MPEGNCVLCWVAFSLCTLSDNILFNLEIQPFFKNSLFSDDLCASIYRFINISQQPCVPCIFIPCTQHMQPVALLLVRDGFLQN